MKRLSVSLTLLALQLFLPLTFGGHSGRFFTRRATIKASVLKAHLSKKVSVSPIGRRTPLIRLGQGHQVVTRVRRLDGSEYQEHRLSQPRAICSVDFNKDGVPDVATAGDDRKITIHLGSPDTIFPDWGGAQQRGFNSPLADSPFIDSPFISPALELEAPEPIDLLASGDLAADSNPGIVFAARGSKQLYFHPGFASAGFGRVQEYSLPGAVSALITADINYKDGLDDLIVAVTDGDRSKLVVYAGPQGALNSRAEEIPLPARTTSLTHGQLNDDIFADLAIAAGNSLLMVPGRDRKLYQGGDRPAQAPGPNIDSRTFSFEIQSVLIEDDGTIVLLSTDGNIHFLEKPQVFEKGQAAAHSLNDWNLRTVIEGMNSGAAHLVRAKISGDPVDDLVVVDPVQKKLHVLMTGAAKSSSVAAGAARTHLPLVSSFNVEGEPLAVLPMRLNSDALTDLVVLHAGQSAFSVVMTGAGDPFVVSNTNDSGPGSLREAINSANQSPGADSIIFRIGTGPQTINLASALHIADTVIIDGQTQPGFSTKPIIELRGPGPGGRHFDCLLIHASYCVVRGLVINNFNGNAMILGDFERVVEGNIIEGNFIGVNLEGAAAARNSENGVLIGREFAQHNLIGGTTIRARNVISGNGGGGNGGFSGIAIFGHRGAVGNRIEGNFIGTDYDGKNRIPNANEGVLIGDEATGNSIGGAAPGAGNLISGNNLYGIQIQKVGTRGNLVQGNLVGTDQTGTRALGNGQGVLITQAPDNIIGGSAPGLSNIIAGNDGNGIGVGIRTFDPNTGAPLIGQTGATIVGNFIGTDESHRDIGNGACGIFVDAKSITNTIVSNTIAFNKGGSICIPNASILGDSGMRINIRRNAYLINNGVLPIDLGSRGREINDHKDVDQGANGLQNYPEITSVIPAASNLMNIGTASSFTATVEGIFKGKPGVPCVLEFYFACACENGDASCLLDRIPIHTITVTPSSDGVATFSTTLSYSRDAKRGFICCTAIDPNENTSEYSPCIAVNNESPTIMPGILRASFEGTNKVIMEGRNFGKGAVVLVDEEEIKTSNHAREPDTKLVFKKKIKKGRQVVFQVKNPDGTKSLSFKYERQ